MHEPQPSQVQDGDNTATRSPVDISPHNLTPENNNKNDEDTPYTFPVSTHRLTIKLPPMTPNGVVTGLRRSTRRTTSLGTENSLPSGSEYHGSEKSMEVDPDADAEGEEEVPSPEPKIEYTTTGRGRRIAKKSYRESESEADPISMDVGDIFDEPAKYRNNDDDDEDDDDDEGPRRRTRRPSKLNGFIVSDEEQQPSGGARYSTRSRSRKPPPKPKPSTSNTGRSTRGDAQRAARQARRARRNAKAQQEEDGYVDEEQSPSSPDGEFDDAPRTSSDVDADMDGEGDADADVDADGGDIEQEGKPYALRQRAKINYAIPPPLEEMRPLPKPGGGRGKGNGAGGTRTGGNRPGARRGPGWSANGAELGRWMGMGADDSVSISVSQD